MTALELAHLSACALGIFAGCAWWREQVRTKRLWRINRDDAETDESVRDIARPVLGRAAVDGDSYGVPPLDDIARELVRRAKHAESACEELRASLMRGSAVASVERHSKNARADKRLDVVVIAGEPHAFTDSVLPRARKLYRRAVAKGQIHPLPSFNPAKK